MTRYFIILMMALFSLSALASFPFEGVWEGSGDIRFKNYVTDSNIINGTYSSPAVRLKILKVKNTIQVDCKWEIPELDLALSCELDSLEICNSNDLCENDQWVGSFSEERFGAALLENQNWLNINIFARVNTDESISVFQHLSKYVDGKIVYLDKAAKLYRLQ